MGRNPQVSGLRFARFHDRDKCRVEALTGVNLKTSPQRDALHMALRLAACRIAAP
jgi:hypothetical protein